MAKKQKLPYIKPIPGYPSYYACYLGFILKQNGNNFYTLDGSQVHNGYLTVKIKHRVKVHRLVALAYIPNPNDLPIVCHKDNNPTNNHVDNLYWGTQSDNMKQMVLDGRQRKSKIAKHKPTVLKLHNQGFSVKEIVSTIGISDTSVRRLIKNRI